MPRNRLSHEKSPYLLQHATNPVDWYPWSPEAFQKAIKEQKPVFLSIGYSTCHWCHVMAHESFEDESIAAFLNEHFVAIKVDREERPDIDHVYMSAVQAMTGQGGWPLSVFLTPDKKPFYGGTYFPPQPKWGAVGFRDLLESIHRTWVMDKSNIMQSAVEITEHLQTKDEIKNDSLNIDQNFYHKAMGDFSRSFDPQHGGFSRSPKFPIPHALLFLLDASKLAKDESASKMAHQTLLHMANGGIYDHLGGGFHRYSVDESWHVPHFEKMLYDQAMLVMAYTRGYQDKPNPLYKRIVDETLGYVMREMTFTQGGFYSAQDADSEGREGAFYVWTKKEIESILSQDVAKRVCAYLNVQEDGNVHHDPHGEFVGQNVLYSNPKVDNDLDLDMKQALKRLFDARSKRIPVHLDDKVLCDWNGLMIAAFALAGSVFDNELYIHQAEEAAQFILTHMMPNGQLQHTYRDGQASIEAMLDDYAFLSYGLLALYEANANLQYFEKAIELINAMMDQFEGDRGGFYMVKADHGLLTRPITCYDGALPSGNSVAVHVLFKAYALTKDSRFLTSGQNLLSRYSSEAARYALSYAFFIAGCAYGQESIVELQISGSDIKAQMSSLRAIFYHKLIPGLVVKYNQNNRPFSGVICHRGTCSLPVIDLQSLREKL